jgi:putative transposase
MQAAPTQRLLKRLLHKQGSRPRRTVTDKLGSLCRCAAEDHAGAHRSHKSLNPNRAEIPMSRCENKIGRCRGSDRGTAAAFRQHLLRSPTFLVPYSRRSAIASRLKKDHCEAIVYFKVAA